MMYRIYFKDSNGWFHYGPPRLAGSTIRFAGGVYDTDNEAILRAARADTVQVDSVQPLKLPAPVLVTTAVVEEPPDIIQCQVCLAEVRPDEFEAHAAKHVTPLTHAQKIAGKGLRECKRCHQKVASQDWFQHITMHGREVRAQNKKDRG